MGVNRFLIFSVVFTLLVTGVLALNESSGQLINDASRLNPTYVKEIIKNQEVQGLQDALAEAREHHLKVSIAGKRHSMGGHAFYPGSVVLDMTKFDKILSIDREARIITVQSGATWAQIMEAINPYNLSIEVMQAYNAFTVGGSLSVNVHESDPHFGPLIESVRSFRLLLANGTIVNVSREEHADLFGLVQGGYGLFGVILDVDLDLTDNEIYEKKEYTINVKDYLQFFRERLADPKVRMIFARVSIVPGKSLLRETIVTTYEQSTRSQKSRFNLDLPKKQGLKRYFFGLSRNYEWGKKLRWFMQKKLSNVFEPKLISRNNVMNGDLAYLNYNSSENTDVLHEYFIPVERLPEFLNDLRGVVEQHQLNLLSATIRYIPKNTESVLTYSSERMFGVVLYFNVGLSKEEQAEGGVWTRELIDYAIEKGGTYYLPYQMYGTSVQIHKAYPRLDEFFKAKRNYDPQELFMNSFYARYAKQ